MNRLPLTEIDDGVRTHKGFDSRGCFNCPCQDACCRFGASIDKESYDLIFANREKIEEKTGTKLEDSFEDKWEDDPEYLGGNSIRSTVKNGYCAFHKKDRGCALYDMAINHGTSKRIVPSICRLFPISWHQKMLVLSDDIPETCNTLDPENTTDKSLFQTQKTEIEDIFEQKNKT